MMANEPRQTKFYKDKRNGQIMGVCAGLADYTGVDVTLMRIMVAFAIFMSGGSALLLYLIAGIVAQNRPADLTYSDEEDEKFWRGVRVSPKKSARRINSQFRELDRRLADIESYVTNENRVLARQIDELR
ncbi:envelope stress response membrane protein PspC [Sphingomicrobium sediminis]|uniref:Envelope stress response membrane protein PspC n=1 Tax=Sphingomicrobium sediminis TaxID=2950949 RepID=A0A9X2EKA3_9SPHN|nr:envelope stress response membrane protein PspC [Sphingomicrobium sediminis]MCM8556919.1 envelope stress response membrane protein PspC [Sphingomicrobium sediminis]